MKTQLTLSAAVLVLLAACADSGANYRPILGGTPTAAYEADLNACQALARSQFEGEATASAMLGAGAGAVLGELDGDDALGGAIAGALAGGVAGSVEVNERRQAIVVECLRGRGHPVVG